jgi:hypothetical protein
VPPTPISPELLPDLLADTIVALRSGHPVRVALDGAPSSRAGELAGAVAQRLRVSGRAPTLVDTDYFLRPASLRLERGREDPDAYYDDWLDVGGLRREVLDPAGAGGSGRIVPAMRDPETDRATRTPYQQVPPDGVVLVTGALLLGRALPFELTVHLRQSAAALARRTAPELRWSLPAFARYEADVSPATEADVVIFSDDPRHPAVLLPGR